MSRKDWNGYFLGILDKVAERATCDRGRSGCVIVSKNMRIVATGYVGAPSGFEHCDEVGHLFIEKKDGDKVTNHCIRTLHAEQNAICQAALEGISIEGGIVFCTMTPCPVCARMFIQCKIKEIVCQYDYQDSDLSKQELEKAGIKLTIMNDKLSY